MGRFFAKIATQAVSAVTRLRDLRKVLAVSLVLALTGCGMAIQYASEGSGGSATSGDSLSDLDSLADDGAQDQCTLYDTSSPNRSTCIACYDSLVSTYCPDQTSIGDCVDTDFQEEFPDRLNQCILNSIVAGFTCSLTCDDDEDLDESSCSCVSRATQSTGLSAISLIDVGQFDSGPPVVTAYADTTTLTKTVPASDTCEFTGTEGSSVYLSVRNRGGTMFRDNTYSVTEDSSATGVVPSFSPASALTTLWQGLNAYLNYSLTIGNSTSGEMITTDYSGEAGTLERLAGAPFEVEPSATPSPLPSVTPASGDEFSEMEMMNPTAITRDIYGNIYFADTWIIADDQRSSIWVLCMTSGNWCTTDDVGEVVPIAGYGTGAEFYRDNDGQDREDAQIQMITALRVDISGNVYFAEYGRSSTDTDGDGFGENTARDAVVSVVCRTVGSGFCSGPGWSAEAVYAIAGYANGIDEATGTYYNEDWVDTTEPAHWITSFDLEVDGSAINLYVARRTLTDGSPSSYGTLWAYCGFDTDAMGPCAEEGVGNGVDIAGSGGTTKYFSDVVATHLGNLLLISPTSGRLSVYCQDVTGDDGVCGDEALTGSSSTGLHEITEDEAGDASDLDPVENSDPPDGTAIKDTNLVAPAKILTSRMYAGEFSDPDDFHDLNFVIASHHRRTDTTNDYAAGGNTLRVFCLEATGWCRDLDIGKSYIFAGIPGRTGTGGSAASSATSIAFGNINGVTYDNYKNLVFSSSYPALYPTTDPSDPSYHEDITAFDNSIYRLKLRVQSNSFGAKFVFTDSNAQSSYYCLSLKARIECGSQLLTYDSDDDPDTEDVTSYTEACTCSLIPSNGNPEGYWRGTSSTADCD